ncbi:hypothetical protein [Paenibacillus sp. GCM10027626]|uniref:hypothetical protein n=1 Tax=Paenibacillus sp. GCM10027626 TaxID=3273411 RepID=UPI003626596F
MKSQRNDSLQTVTNEFEKHYAARAAASATGKLEERPGRGTIGNLLPLYCNRHSSYYASKALEEELRMGAAGMLASQHASGCISLANCNIDSPPDTAFAVHAIAVLYQLADRFGPDTACLREVKDALALFLKRAEPCLLTGGIHTPNHRWVMAGALAKMYEFTGGDERYRQRAFQYIDEGLDLTADGEWTERSNAFYNGEIAMHFYHAGTIFGHEPILEAIRHNLLMMRYMLHDDHTIVTDYSGRQDLGTVQRFRDTYYIASHLMASYYKDDQLAALAAITELSSAKGWLALAYWLLEEERMELHDPPALSDRYTVLLGEGVKTAVPTQIPYLGQRERFPHGASVLRHRNGKLSVTAMAGQTNLLAIQYGAARMIGLKLTAGWFGVAGIAFPTIRKTAVRSEYELDIELEGCYFAPLPRAHTEGLNGRYADMPNHLRAKTHVQILPIMVRLTMLEDGVALRVVSEETPNIYLQLVCMFDKTGTVAGDGLEIDPATQVRMLKNGDALFSRGTDHIRLSAGSWEHPDIVSRNDVVADALNVAINWQTPANRLFTIQGFSAGE